MYQSVNNISLGLTTPLAKFHILGSGSAATSSILAVDGAAGRLFTVNDSLSGSLFSVNLVSGLPVIEAFSDNTVRIGQHGQKALYVSQSRVGMGTETPIGAKLEVTSTNTGITMTVDPAMNNFSSSNWVDTVSIGSRNNGDYEIVHIPKFWAPKYTQVSYNTTSSVIDLNYNQYAGAVVDYSIQIFGDGSESSRTGTVWMNFNQGISMTSNEQTTADFGDTSLVVLTPQFGGSGVIINCDNNSTLYNCYVYVSARLLPRFNNQNPF
jgi:hypothetical protein